MNKGGARAGSGGRPDPDALRRNRPSDTTTFFHLPVDGYTEDAPAWPLTRPSARERQLWAALWKRPQAAAWAYFQLDLAVANFVRNQAEAEKPEANTAVRVLVQRQLDTLGLTHAGMAANRWVMAGNAPQTQAAHPVRSDDPDRTSAKDRFLRLQGGKTA